MTRHLRHILFIILFVSIPSGCKAPQGLENISIWTSPSDKLEESLNQHDLKKADDIYAAEAVWFNENHANPEVAGLLKQLAQGMDEQYSGKIVSGIHSVAKLKWPAPEQEWAQIKASLQTLLRDRKELNSVAIFRNAQHRPSYIKGADVVLEDRIRAIKQSAPAAFAQYPLFEAGSFFADYPVPLSKGTFWRDNEAVWKAGVAQAGKEQLLHFFATYKRILSTGDDQLLGERYFAVLCPSVKEASLSTLVEVYEKVCDSGMKLDSIPGVNIAFLDVTSRTLKDKGAIEFPVSITMDMPFAVANTSLRKGFDHEDVKGADIIVLMNLASTKTMRRVDTNNYIKSRFVAGSRRVPNPEWDVLQVELQQATLETMEYNSSKSTDTGNPWSDFGNALSNFSNSLKKGQAKEKIEGLKRKFRETPRYVDEPVYDVYRFQRVEMEAVKSGTVQYYVIDQRNRLYYKDFFEIRSKEFFTVAYNLRESDPDLARHRATNVSEKVVDAYETEAVKVNISDILEHYSSNKAKTTRYASLDAIRKDVIKDRNTAVAKMEKDTYGFDRKQDDRFDSVVVVRASKGLGTGFYVTDDLVLTNYHVVEEQKFIEMKKWNNVETFGKVVAKDVRLDLALIKVQDRGHPVRFYDRKELPLGETVDVIGHPKRLEFTLTRGIVSTIREHESIMGVKGKPVLYVQTDAPINSGNSGGPLFYGDLVVGVNDWVVSKHVAEGLNFSIHYAEVCQFLKDNDVKYLKGK